MSRCWQKLEAFYAAHLPTVTLAPPMEAEEWRAMAHVRLRLGLETVVGLPLGSGVDAGLTSEVRVGLGPGIRRPS